MYKLRNYFFLTISMVMVSFYSINAQTTVDSLSELQEVLKRSNQEIILEAGDYYLEDLPSNSRVINCTGSGNTIDMTGARINTLVGSIREVYFIISGDDNILRNGAIEDFYKNGLDEVTDFSGYNNERGDLAYGLRGDPIMSITGNDNLVEGLEMIVKGSFPYGYGSQYGIGAVNTFGLNKRCGILITGTDGGGFRNTLDGITMYHYAFGHGIFIQEGADDTMLKNCYVEGRMRLSDDIYNDTETYDLPYRTNYLFPADEAESWRESAFPWTASYPIPYGVMYPLSEDGIRSYNNTGSVTVENCTVKQMRGGIRLYLASNATVINSKAIDCGATNFNMPSNGTITGSSGNFTFGPLNDNRLGRSRQDLELTIIPSPNATGPHNIADIIGNNQNIVFHRTPGPLDSDEERAIVVTGDNSTIVNETEYEIILESSASGNTIISCGPVTDRGSKNTITNSTDCDFEEETIAENKKPTVRIDSPVNGAIYNEEESINFVATATDDNEISTVNFYVDGILLATERSAPYDVTRSIEKEGIYEITAIATDNEGATTSAKITITVEKEEEIITDTGFVPDPNKTYYIDSAYHNVRLAATGESEDAYTTTINTTGSDVEWKFIAKGNGYWHLQRAAGGSKPRLRTDVSEKADMQRASNSGTFTYCEITKGDIANSYFLTLPDAPVTYNRLQIDRELEVKMVPSANHKGTWESFIITETISTIAEPVRLEAEDFDSMSGIQTEDSTESGENVGYIDNGDWLRFEDVKLSGITNMDARVSSKFKGGTIEVRTGSTSGTLIGSINVENTGGNQNWITLSTSISNTSGTQDVYLVFTGGSGYLFNINWIEFNTESSRSNKDATELSQAFISDIVMYPNPVKTTTTIQNAINSEVNIYDIGGVVVYTGSILNDTEVIDLSNLATGLYYAEIKKEGRLSMFKVIKE